MTIAPGEVALDQILSQGLLHHQAGRLQHAEHIYREVLKHQPGNAQALHLLGVIAHQCGRNDAALDLLRHSISLKKDDPHSHYNLGVVLQAQGRFAEAIPAFQQATALKPDYHQALNNLGSVLREAGRLDDALAVLGRAILLNPAYAEAHNNWATILRDQGRHGAAVEAYRRAISYKPDYPDAYCNLAIALKNLARIDEALAVGQQAIALWPNYADAHYNLGVVLNAAGRIDEAVAAYRHAIALNPNLAEAHFNLANILRERGHIAESIAMNRRGVVLKPVLAAGHCNLGIALLADGKLDEAIAELRRAIELNPHFPEASCNLGVALQAHGEIDNAVAAFERATVLRVDFAEAHYNLACALLTRGDLARGWEEYRWRLRRPDIQPPPRKFPQPAWDGRPLSGAAILLHAEQGFGDTIQFIRYVPMVVARGGKVIVECPPALEGLLKSIAGDFVLVRDGEPLPAFDVHCPLPGLPGIFATTLQTIPRNVPYLRADEKKIEKWRQRLAQDPASFKVGLSWAGNPSHANDRNRSMPLSAFAPLGGLPDVSFYSLQKGPQARQVSAAPLKVVDLSSHLQDFAETAALVANLDLVISVDTSVAHLAGALAKRTWVLLPFAAEWRWMLDREDSPWYPTMRLFRQPAAGDWDAVVRNVFDAIEQER